MAILVQTQYNARGELLETYEIKAYASQKRHQIRDGGPTFDRGYFHYFEFRADREYTLLRKLEKFLGMLDRAGGQIIFYDDHDFYGLFGKDGMMAHITYVVE